MFSFFLSEGRLYAYESDIYGRRIVTYKDGIIFIHLQLRIASARHNFKWVKIKIE